MSMSDFDELAAMSSKRGIYTFSATEESSEADVRPGNFA